MSKITLATVKSFIKKNYDQLEIKCESDFNGMTDCVENIENPSFSPIEKSPLEHAHKNTMGIRGAWFVFDSRDYFSVFDNVTHTGIYVYNCCGSFTLAVRKQPLKIAA